MLKSTITQPDITRSTWAKRRLRQLLRNLAIGLAVIALYAWALRGLDADLSLLRDSWPYMVDFVTRLLPPDLSVLDVAIKALIETIQMSLWGTTLGAICSIPIAVLSANNIAPLWVRGPVSLLQNAIQSVPSIVLGLFFVAATGLGAPAGMLALGVYTIGYLGTFYRQTIEGVDRTPLESLRVTGASPIQVLQYGIVPQILPTIVGYTVYMFEYNLRAASVLGVVGAGGIGFELVNYIRGFEYPKATTMMLVLLVVITIVELMSSRLRKHLESR
jgi:phosphonate transport system permease protein